MSTVRWPWLLALGLSSCGEKPAAPAPDGKALAQAHCAACHLLPDPSELSRRTWLEQTLPDMGPRMGIHAHGGREYLSDRDDPEVGGLFPAQPLLPPEHWQAIMDYYGRAAPGEPLPQARAPGIPQDLELFEAVPVPRPPGSAAPLTTFLQIDAGNSLLWCGDAAEKSLILYNMALRPLTVLPAGDVIAGVYAADWRQPGERDFLLTTMGSIHPAHTRTGRVLSGRMGADGQLLDGFYSELAGLPRPVLSAPCDLDGDGRRDLLVCGFGYLKGSLEWYAGGTERRVLLEQPGCVRAVVEDVNGDGRADVWALFSQGREALVLFTNTGGGEFSMREVLRFPAAQGSGWFDLADMNGDGRADLIYCAGDNADHSIELKAWHGVSVFLREGEEFQRRAFFPIHGCTKSLARDFDADGDIDLACIAHFPDFVRQPEEAFVFLENTGGLAFRPHALPGAVPGRWLVMDAGDLDGDGDIDLALGNFAFPATPAPEEAQRRFETGPAVLFLRNRSRP